tara:strand:- start:2802 stop:3794 length:993 start_codon:yes stop_codon:yes gene_type:complete
MNKKNKLLIVGSNFGYEHYKILKKYYNFDISVHSPNILTKKNKFKKAELIDDFSLLKKNNQFHTIVCCTKPLIQKKIINMIIKKEILCKYIMLEKPLSNDLKLVENFLRFCINNKIYLRINFTYSNLNISKLISRHLISGNFEKAIFELSFLHHYFKEKNSSWKNFISDGGGFINYYLIHIIFLFVNIFSKIKLEKVNPTLNEGVFSGVDVYFKSQNKVNLELRVRIDQDQYMHNYSIYKKNEHINVYATQKDWYKKYIFEKINKYKISKKIEIKENFESTININYKKLFTKYNKKKISKYYNSIYLTEKICKKINDKITKYDFKKMQSM